MTEIIETGITWDHDEGTIDVSTRSPKVANRLQKLGFKPENPGSKDYLVFRAKESELRIRFAVPRVLSEAQKATLEKNKERFRLHREQAKSDQIGASEAKEGS